MQTKCNRLEQELSLTLEREVSEFVNMHLCVVIIESVLLIIWPSVHLCIDEMAILISTVFAKSVHCECGCFYIYCCHLLFLCLIETT